MADDSTAASVTGATHCFVVPAYGDSPHLRACLDSLRAQTRRSPIVVCSSTPHAGLQALAEEYGARLVLHSPNAGIGHDWNAALEQVPLGAGTEWVTLAHQDDVYLPEFAQRTLAAIARQPQAVMVMTGYGELIGSGASDDRPRLLSPMLLVKRVLLELGFLGRGAIANPAAKRRLLRFGCPVPCPAVTLRTRTGLRFREDLKVNLDWEAWLRLAAQTGAFAYVRQILMLHRIHAGSETSDGIRGGVRAREDLMMFRAQWPAPIARMLARAYATSYATGDEA
ncbi:glycosyltransferase family 2 protein [Pseudoxanthomonas yeongjuensis]|uniref:glycosyltransferase family 2 protein n=1 Tax=Pseudoxanthomonas yeongjuensis TaxID=377616 RepID=UPI0013915D40|nr:glycosyltransferase family A protein [Pseudoxanthomonas yeongjuensis]